MPLIFPGNRDFIVTVTVSFARTPAISKRHIIISPQEVCRTNNHAPQSGVSVNLSIASSIYQPSSVYRVYSASHTSSPSRTFTSRSTNFSLSNNELSGWSRSRHTGYYGYQTYVTQQYDNHAQSASKTPVNFYLLDKVDNVRGINGVSQVCVNQYRQTYTADISRGSGTYPPNRFEWDVTPWKNCL